MRDDDPDERPQQTAVSRKAPVRCALSNSVPPTSAVQSTWPKGARMPRVSSVLATFRIPWVVHALQQGAQRVAWYVSNAAKPAPTIAPRTIPSRRAALDDLVGDRDDDQRLGRLLDEPDGEVGPLAVRQVIGLEQRRTKHADRSAGDEPQEHDHRRSRSARSRDRAKTTTVSGTTKLPSRMTVGIRIGSFVTSVMIRDPSQRRMPTTRQVIHGRFRFTLLVAGGAASSFMVRACRAEPLDALPGSAVTLPEAWRRVWRGPHRH